MKGLIKEGTVMMQAGTLLPESLDIELECYTPGWSTIRDSDRDVVDRNLRRAGWSFFFMAAKVEAIGWGSLGERAIRRAVNHALAGVKPSGFNCLEITELSARRFLGFPYVRLRAHSRHIQKGPVLQELMERNRDQAAVTWAMG